MPSCWIGHYMLLLLLLPFGAGSVSDVSSVTVKLNEKATLSCSKRCSGWVRWTVYSNSEDTLAECDQTSCRSAKEGYQMQNGDQSLTITDANFRKRNLYSCYCDGKVLCDVQLKIEPVNTTVHLKSGESLVLDLDVSDPVEVLYNSTGAVGPSSVQICTMDRHQLQIKPEYKHRASAAFKLRAVTPSDSGVYTIRDTRNEEILRIYSVIVRADDSDAQRRNHRTNETCCSAPPDQGAAVPAWMMVVMVVMVAALVLCGVLVVVCVRQRREIQLLQAGSVGGGGGGGGNQNVIQMNGRVIQKPEEQETSSPLNNNLQHV